MDQSGTKLILAGGIAGLALLIVFGLFLTEVELEPVVEPIVEPEPVVEPMVEPEPASIVGPVIHDADYIVEKIATGLSYPTTMAFVGEDMLVLEKYTGKVIRIQDNGVAYTTTQYSLAADPQ